MVTNQPIQVYFIPNEAEKAFITPSLSFLPIENSTIIKGIDQRKRNINQGIKKEPPYWPASLGKRQILPAPMAIPRAAIKNAQREVK